MRERRGVGGVGKPNGRIASEGTANASTRGLTARTRDESMIVQYALTGALIAAALLTMYLYMSSVSINSIFFR